MEHHNSRLKELRESRKWSISEVADKLCLAKSTYAGYEYGRRDVPNEMLIKISELYGVTIDYILGKSDEPNDIGTSSDDFKREIENRIFELSDEELMKTTTFTLDGVKISKQKMNLLIQLLKSDIEERNKK